METRELESLAEALLYRSEADAVGCKHLRRSPLIRPSEVLRPVAIAPQKSVLLLPHEQPANGGGMRMMPATLWPACPPGGLTCGHPKNVEWAQGLMPAEVRHGTDHIEVTLEFCRTCPLFEERKDQ
jgi:hypothetical protein